MLSLAQPAWSKPKEKKTQRVTCDVFCEEVDKRCPDLFLGNDDTCKWACSVLDQPQEVFNTCTLPKLVPDVPVNQPDVEENASPDVSAEEEIQRIGPDDVPAPEELAADWSALPSGFGAVYLPSITDPEEVPVAVIYQDKKAVAEGRTGKRILLRPGDYSLRFGSGPVNLQPKVDFQVVEGRTTVSPTVWSSLEIDVVDNQFVPFRGTYELIDDQTHEVIGLGFGADALLGEKVKPWILKPGLYKIVQSGGTYRDRTNFVTVRLVPGQRVRFVLVKDPDTDVFEGGGERGDGEEESQGVWKVSGVVGGDLAFANTNFTGEQEGWALNFKLFLDGSAQLSAGKHQWVTRLEVEEGQSRPAGKKNFFNLDDRVYLHTIYTMRLLPWLGPYIRAGVESKILPRYAELDSTGNVTEYDRSGSVVKVHENVDRVRLGGTWEPTDVKEGLGGNFQVFRSREATLDLRMGFGAWQNYVGDLLSYNAHTLKPVESSSSYGIEGTALGQARVTRFITLSTEFDGLMPFNDFGAPIFSWRNQASLRLASFASFVYRLNLQRTAASRGDVETAHDLQLRFSYTLF